MLALPDMCLQKNLALWSAAAKDLARLWVALVKQGGVPSPGGGSEEVARYDACYESGEAAGVLVGAAVCVRP